ncbi:MAG: phosphomannomutase, partial [Deltaproteobacteria bacterium]|nr:phosphomannomutase [Deltaproteobacteria bacterium]
MEYNPKVFREYDIRGYVDKDLSEEFAFKLGIAIGIFAKRENLENLSAIVGFDCRESSPRYSDSLCRGLVNQGFQVSTIGMVPTPVVYHATTKLRASVGVAVTGSHNPKDMNGFKIIVNERSLSGKEIQDLRTIFENLSIEQGVNSDSDKIRKLEYLNSYIDDIVSNVEPFLGNRNLDIALDYGNGVAGITCIPIMEKLGIRAHHLFSEPNPDFPNHHPDPTVEKNLEELKHYCREHSISLGFAFDGDGDRIGMIIGDGRIVPGDMLLLLLANSLLKHHPGETIIGDVKCSSVLFDEIQRLGGKP